MATKKTTKKSNVKKVGSVKAKKPQVRKTSGTKKKATKSTEKKTAKKQMGKVSGFKATDVIIASDGSVYIAGK